MNTSASKRELFEDLPVPKALKIMILPAVISQLTILFYNMADTFYIGCTNNPYMVAGISLLLPVFNLTLCISALAGIGGGTLISRLLGERREKEAEVVFSFSLYLAVAGSLIFSLIMFLFMAPILVVLGASEKILLFAEQYTFFVIVLGAAPTVFSHTMAHLIRGLGMSKEAGIGIILGGALNIVLDPLFMFILFPVGWEVLGIAVATLLSNCISCAYFLFVIHKNRESALIRFTFVNKLPNMKSVNSLLSVGSSSATATFLFDVDYMILDKLMAAYGDIALAAIGIVLKVERLPLNTGVGICQGMVPLVAYNYSAKNGKRMFDFIKYSLLSGLVISILSIIFYEYFASSIINVFIGDKPTMDLATAFIKVRILSTPLMFISFFTVHLFQGFGKGEIALMLGVVRWLGFNIPMLYILNYIFGIYGLVWAQALADALTVLLSIVVYRLKRPRMN